MNTIWSTYLQKIGTLYQTRQLRFDDRFMDSYKCAFNIANAQNILEIGAGPGALTQAMKRWYPKAHVIGSDRDTAFIEFAKNQAPHIEFIEADINALPFDNDTFDATISNTVQEHVEPSKFFGEQHRVLRTSGVCLVLSARRGINISASVINEMSDFENELRQRTDNYYQSIDDKYGVGKYGCTEQELALAMAKHGFKDIQTHYLTINLTPDSEQYDKNFAIKIIETNRRVHLDSLEYLPHIAPNVVTTDEIDKWTTIINQKYDTRIEHYHNDNKLCDTNVSVTMILRGIK